MESDPRQSAIRIELIRFVNAAGARRVLAPILVLGAPGSRRVGDQVRISEQQAADAGPGSRPDLVDRALEDLRSDAPAPLAWITRSGALAPGDVDFGWLSATFSAFARHGLELTAFYVITQRGWVELLTGELISLRVRPRRSA